MIRSTQIARLDGRLLTKSHWRNSKLTLASRPYALRVRRRWAGVFLFNSPCKAGAYELTFHAKRPNLLSPKSSHRSSRYWEGWTGRRSHKLLLRVAHTLYSMYSNIYVLEAGVSHNWKSWGWNLPGNYHVQYFHRKSHILVNLAMQIRASSLASARQPGFCAQRWRNQKTSSCYSGLETLGSPVSFMLWLFFLL